MTMSIPGTARAIWALGEGTQAFRDSDPQFADRLQKSARRTYAHLDTLMSEYGIIERENGFPQPQWLVYRSAGDATSELMLGLIALAESASDGREREYVSKFAEGLVAMQQGEATHFPYGAFLSWKNVWHGWGNSQAHALLLASALLPDKKLFEAARLEADHFYSYLAGKEYPQEFVFHVPGSENKIEKKQFPQIAYGFRPMVMAALTLFRQTREKKYAGAAARYASWFLGNNIASTPMYDPRTGRCFDGIQSAEVINRNAGAESTIEALLVMLEIDKTPEAFTAITRFWTDRDSRN